MIQCHFAVLSSTYNIYYLFFFSIYFNPIAPRWGRPWLVKIVFEFFFFFFFWGGGVLTGHLWSCELAYLVRVHSLPYNIFYASKFTNMPDVSLKS